MTTEPTQLVFDLPHRHALEAEDFLVSSANAMAVELVDTWPDWPHWAAVVTGSSGCGKSHLANVWRLRSNASEVAASKLNDETIARLKAARALVVEDLDQGIGDERVLFHLLNVARQEKMTILLTSKAAPGVLEIGLPDLRSRLRALPVVAIEAPDEQLLRVVLVKLFSDRQLVVDPQVVSFIALRMERSMKAAGDIVENIDKRALAMRRKVTRQLAQTVLESMAD